MTLAATVTRDVHLEQLRAFHEGLLTALGEAGVGGARLGELLARCVIGECLQCGMRVTGEDIAAAFAAVEAGAAANPKHARLLKHYCARAGCPSYFYRFSFLGDEAVDWARLLTRGGQAEAGQAAARDAERAEVRTRRRRLGWRRAGWVLAGVAGVGLLWGARHWWTTGALPGMEPKLKYQVDPRSLPADPNGRRP